MQGIMYLFLVRFWVSSAARQHRNFNFLKRITFVYGTGNPYAAILRRFRGFGINLLSSDGLLFSKMYLCLIKKSLIL
jgi:hypothetical protein